MNLNDNMGTIGVLFLWSGASLEVTERTLREILIKKSDSASASVEMVQFQTVDGATVDLELDVIAGGMVATPFTRKALLQRKFDHAAAHDELAEEVRAANKPKTYGPKSAN